MKSLTIALLITIAFTANAQKEYTAINGITYHVADTVRLGRGSAPNGDFLYLTLGGLATSMREDDNNIGRRYANTAVVIKRIKTYRIKGVEKHYFVVGGGNIVNYYLGIDDAIEACEVVPCKNEAAAVPDVADEISKLKKLLDSGAITQEEYDAQKKKLLNQ